MARAELGVVEEKGGFRGSGRCEFEVREERDEGFYVSFSKVTVAL